MLPFPVAEAPEPAPEPAASAPQTAAADAPAQQDGKGSAPKKTVRVDLDRIDKLINLVGELVINQAMLTQRLVETDAQQPSRINEGMDEFKALTREIQERVMAIRAQPVKPLFQRMTRIVRETGGATGKPVRFVSEGEETEVDTTIVERLAEPLTHMIRNAVDHGLESPEARAKTGKPAEGVVRLSASHRSGRIVIEVADDGAGINRKKVFEIAVNKGLIAEDAVLSDAEIDNLLFLPGFSTASAVSDLSGRGVGMDVVKRSIQSLGGRTSITSAPGLGTTFTISLPLTLAVLDGIIVRIVDQTLVIPLTNVVETLRLKRADVRSLGPGSDVALVRGTPLPVIDVGAILGFRNGPADPEASVVIIAETQEGGRAAVLVDEIYDQRQVVMKGLESNYGAVPGIAAATILGDGRVALILDMDAIAEEVSDGRKAMSFSLAG